jgi:hypothetical protein
VQAAIHFGQRGLRRGAWGTGILSDDTTLEWMKVCNWLSTYVCSGVDIVMRSIKLQQ